LATQLHFCLPRWHLWHAADRSPTFVLRRHGMPFSTHRSHPSG
jgi:hypothetical protein